MTNNIMHKNLHYMVVEKLSARGYFVSINNERRLAMDETKFSNEKYTFSQQNIEQNKEMISDAFSYGVIDENDPHLDFFLSYLHTNF